MPDMDGLALLKEIRARGCQSIFIVATEKRRSHIPKDALNTGADYYLQKGADMAHDVSRMIDFIRIRVPQKNADYEQIAWTRFYKSVVENGPVLICRIKPDGTFSFVNKPCVHFFKKTYRKLVQENFFTYIPDNERPEILAHLDARSPENPDCHLLHHVRAGNGRFVILELSYHVFFSTSGAIEEYQIVGRDMHSLIRIGENELGPEDNLPAATTIPASGDEEEEPNDWSDLMAMLQSLDAPVFAVDKNGVIIGWSTELAGLTGVPAEAIVGKGNREYAVPFYGMPHPMLIDHLIRPPGSGVDRALPAARKVGDVVIGEREAVTIQGRPMLLWGKCSPVYDASGQMIAAIEAIAVSESLSETDNDGEEVYLGGISSLTLKISGEGVGGALPGTIGSSAGGFGVYATTRRLFIIRNPDLDVTNSQRVQFGTFIMDELFGTVADTRQKTLGELENTRVFEAEKGELEKIVLKKPVLLSGYLTLIKNDGSTFRVYIDHKKAYTFIESLMKLFAPDILQFE